MQDALMFNNLFTVEPVLNGHSKIDKTESSLCLEGRKYFTILPWGILFGNTFHLHL